MRTRLVLATLPVALIGVAVASASAAPKAKPFTQTYEASAPVPAADLACDGTVAQGQHVKEIKIPAAGKVQIDLSRFLGDWDLHVDANGKEIGVSQQIQPLGEGESVALKLKKATTIVIKPCNYNGGPTGTVTVKYTP